MICRAFWRYDFRWDLILRGSLQDKGGNDDSGNGA
jgi:hypothetical protein